MPESADALQTPTELKIPVPRLKPARWADAGDAWEADTHDADLTALPSGASKDGTRVRFPKTKFKTEEEARAALGRIYPSLADGAANPDGTYNLYNRMLFSEGTWNGDRYSAEDMREMVRAHSEIGHELRPWGELGHDPTQQYAKSAGFPRVGTVANLRTAPHEKHPEKLALYGDILNVPATVYHAIEQKGYPTRSPAIYHDLNWNGRQYSRVFRSISLLGTEEAGNPTLPDLFRSYDRAADSAAGELHVYAFQADDEEVHDDLNPTAPSGPDDPERLRRVQRAYAARGGALFPNLPLRITYPAGSTRSGTDSAGRAWTRTMTADYASIPGSTGADGDAVDAYLNPEYPTPAATPDQGGTVYVIAQHHPQSGEYDEDKVMLGFPGLIAARDAYLAHMPDPASLGSIKAVPYAEFLAGLRLPRDAAQTPDEAEPRDPSEGAPDLTAEARRRAAQTRLAQTRARAALARSTRLSPSVAPLLFDYAFDPSQPRDATGKWTSEGDQAAHHALKALDNDGQKTLGHATTAKLALTLHHLKNLDANKAYDALAVVKNKYFPQLKKAAEDADAAGNHAAAYANYHIASHYGTLHNKLSTGEQAVNVTHHQNIDLPDYHPMPSVSQGEFFAADAAWAASTHPEAKKALFNYKTALGASLDGKHGKAAFWLDKAKEAAAEVDESTLGGVDKSLFDSMKPKLGMAPSAPPAPVAGNYSQDHAMEGYDAAMQTPAYKQASTADMMAADNAFSNLVSAAAYLPHAPQEAALGIEKSGALIGGISDPALAATVKQWQAHFASHPGVLQHTALLPAAGDYSAQHVTDGHDAFTASPVYDQASTADKAKVTKAFKEFLHAAVWLDDPKTASKSIDDAANHIGSISDPTLAAAAAKWYNHFASQPDILQHTVQQLAQNAAPAAQPAAQPAAPAAQHAAHLDSAHLSAKHHAWVTERRARAAYHAHGVAQAMQSGDAASYDHHVKALKAVAGQFAAQAYDMNKAGETDAAANMTLHKEHVNKLVKALDKDFKSGGLSPQSTSLLADLGEIGKPLKATPAGLIDPQAGGGGTAPASGPTTPATAPTPPKTANTPAAPPVAPIAGLSHKPHADVAHKLIKSGLGGSNGAALYESKDGKQHVVKTYNAATQAHSEHVSNQVYAALGIPVANTHMTDTPGGFASEMLDGHSPVDLTKMTKAEAQQFLQGFMADVVLGNRDVTGTGGGGGDNLLRGKDGKIYRIDNGGTLLHYATTLKNGGKKTDSDLDNLHELDGFVTKNAQYKQILKKAGYSDWAEIPGIEGQIKQVGEALSDANIAKLASAPGISAADQEKMKDTLTKRRDLVLALGPQLAAKQALATATKAHRATPEEKAKVKTLLSRNGAEVGKAVKAGQFPHHEVKHAYAKRQPGYAHLYARNPKAPTSKAEAQAILDDMKKRGIVYSNHAITDDQWKAIQEVTKHFTSGHAAWISSGNTEAVKGIIESGVIGTTHHGLKGQAGDNPNSKKRLRLEQDIKQIYHKDDGKDFAVPFGAPATMPGMDHAAAGMGHKWIQSSGYGDARFVFHPHVADRTVYYNGDTWSLDHSGGKQQFQRTGMNRHEAAILYALGQNSSSMEAIPVGGIHMEDVAHIETQNATAAAKVRKHLDDNGYHHIPVYITSKGSNGGTPPKLHK